MEYAAFRKQQFDEYFKSANIESYTDPDVKRKLKILKDIGTAALSEEDLTSLNAAKNRMTTIYNNGRICPFAKPDCELETEGLTLDPEIELLMASSTDFDEMKWTWEQWHEKSGKPMKEDYQTYVDFMNKAAVANGKYRTFIVCLIFDIEFPSQATLMPARDGERDTKTRRSSRKSTSSGMKSSRCTMNSTSTSVISWAISTAIGSTKRMNSFPHTYWATCG